LVDTSYHHDGAQSLPDCGRFRQWCAPTYGLVNSIIEMPEGAQTLHCPTCGAAIDDSDAISCRYCGTRLALIACPKCFGRMFVGSKFCPHCGGGGGPG
jgi:hypothetical protein